MLGMLASHLRPALSRLAFAAPPRQLLALCTLDRRTNSRTASPGHVLAARTLYTTPSRLASTHDLDSAPSSSSSSARGRPGAVPFLQRQSSIGKVIKYDPLARVRAALKKKVPTSFPAILDSRLVDLLAGKKTEQLDPTVRSAYHPEVLEFLGDRIWDAVVAQSLVLLAARGQSTKKILGTIGLECVLIPLPRWHPLSSKWLTGRSRPPQHRPAAEQRARRQARRGVQARSLVGQAVLRQGLVLERRRRRRVGGAPRRALPRQRPASRPRLSRTARRARLLQAVQADVDRPARLEARHRHDLTSRLRPAPCRRRPVLGTRRRPAVGAHRQPGLGIGRRRTLGTWRPPAFSTCRRSSLSGCCRTYRRHRLVAERVRRRRDVARPSPASQIAQGLAQEECVRQLLLSSLLGRGADALLRRAARLQVAQARHRERPRRPHRARRRLPHAQGEARVPLQGRRGARAGRQAYSARARPRRKLRLAARQGRPRPNLQVRPSPSLSEAFLAPGPALDFTDYSNTCRKPTKSTAKPAPPA